MLNAALERMKWTTKLARYQSVTKRQEDVLSIRARVMEREREKEDSKLE